MNRCALVLQGNKCIVCLQDTHLIEDDIMAEKELWNNDVYIYGGKTNSRGVAILLNNNGNYLNLLIKLSSMKINLLTLYGPNIDSPSFFEEISKLLENVSADYNILCGDFNVALDNEIDMFNYRHVNNPRARQAIFDLMRQYDLSDIYRDLHPDTNISHGEDGILSNRQELIVSCGHKYTRYNEHLRN